MTPHLADTPVLETSRLVLRAPASRDWEAFADFLGSDRSRFVGGPVPRPQAWRSLGHIIGHWVLRGFGIFVFCGKGSDTAIGMTGPYCPEGWAEPEIAWSVWAPAHEGKGYAAEAATAARDFAFRVLGWKTAVSYMNPENTRSRALAERLGCIRDDTAPLPGLPGWDGTLVYRHPVPEKP